jgi:D-beta-D-heptose 7-phosphate kinase/D-beta-D-heptose 1-phosphate adenosyltransferase
MDMRNLFHKFNKTGVLVLGDVIVDHYIWGKVKRISPEAPVPVVEVSEENLRLGGAANVAHNIASLGGKVFISGVVGKDGMGEVLLSKMREKGINTEGIVIDSQRPTIVKTRVIAHNQQVVRFDREIKSDVSGKTRSSILKYVKERLPEIKAVIISDYCKGVITKSFVKGLLGSVGTGVFVAVDPKVGHFDYYKDVSIITPNIDEASAGSGIEITDDKSLVTAGRILLKKTRCKAVLITRGSKGMTIFDSAGKEIHIPTFARDVYDVTGAGDTVIAAFTLCHAAGAGLKDAAIFANHAAGAVVGEVGTAVVTPDMIASSIRRSRKI